MSNDLTIVGYVGDLNGTGMECRFFNPVVKDNQGKVFVVGSSNPESHSRFILAKEDGPSIFILPEELHTLLHEDQDSPQSINVVGPKLVELLHRYLPEASLTQRVQSWPVVSEKGHRGDVGSKFSIHQERSEMVNAAFRKALEELQAGTIKGDAYDLFYAIYPRESLEVVGYMGIYAILSGNEQLIEQQLLSRAAAQGFPSEHYLTLMRQMALSMGVRL
jgi:hypothetical protein